MLEMKRLLVLAAGVLQVPVIQKAKTMGIFVIAIDENPHAVGFKYADKTYVADITDEETILKIAIDEKIDGVIHPCSEVSMHVMGRINDELGLSGITKEMAYDATNKSRMRCAFDKNNAPSPKSFCTDNVDIAWEIFNKYFKSEAILKPSRNSGSRGINKITHNISHESFVTLYNYSFTQSKDNQVLIEQFVEGPEFSVEIIVWKHEIHILAVTDKKTTGAPYFVELGHSQPSLYPENIIRQIQEAAIVGVQSLRLNNCACHAEIKYEDGTAYIMEIGARLGGDFISTELTHLSTGIDMVAAAINVALGIVPNLAPTNKGCGVCIRYICPNPGKLVNISYTQILNNEHIYDYDIFCNVGDTIPEITSSTSRSGYVIVTEETVLKAITLAEQIVSEIHFDIIEK